MALRGTVPESYVTEFTLAYEGTRTIGKLPFRACGTNTATLREKGNYVEHFTCQ